MEAEDPAVVHDAVDDRGGHVPVAEHVAPSAGLEVRGGDDAAGLVAVRAGLEQFDHRSIMPVVIRSGDAFARVEPHASAFGSSRPTASAPSGCA